MTQNKITPSAGYQSTISKCGYFVTSTQIDHGFAVVAANEAEATKLLWLADIIPGLKHSDIVVLPVPTAIVTGLPVGLVENNRNALCRGLYDFIRGQCDICHTTGELTCYDEQALCEDCIYELEADASEIDDTDTVRFCCSGTKDGCGIPAMQEIVDREDRNVDMSNHIHCAVCGKPMSPDENPDGDPTDWRGIYDSERDPEPATIYDTERDPEPETIYD